MGSEETEQPPAPASERLATDYERRAPVATLVAIGAVASVLGIALALLIDWFPTAATTQAQSIDTLYDVLLIASVPIFVLVMVVVLYCVWRFRMRPGEEEKDGPPIHGNTRLEVIWTLIPALLMLGLSTYAYVVLKDIEEAPAAGQELNVRVVGEQFTWTFFYEGPGDEEVASPQLHLPVDRSVRFTIQTKDVLHSFWVPEFRMKLDTVPGIDTSYRVTPNREGTYAVVCAELCGIGHATMRQTVRVMPAEEFEAWLQERAEGADSAQGAGGEQRAEEVDGAAVFAAAGCGGCHVLADAGANGDTGPDLDEVLPDRDRDHILQSIVEPNAEITPGYSPGIMPPNYDDTLTEQELQALTDYLHEVTR